MYTNHTFLRKQFDEGLHSLWELLYVKFTSDDDAGPATIVAGYYGFTFVICVSIFPSVVHTSVVLPSIFHFRTIILSNIKGYSPNLVCIFCCGDVVWWDC